MRARLSTIGFFRGALVLPLLVPLAAMQLGNGPVSALFALSLVVAGVPYLLFAAWLWFALGRTRKTKSLEATLDVPHVVLRAPLLFIPPCLLAWVVWSGIQNGLGVALLVSVVTFIPFALWILLLGYVYVGASVLVLKLLLKLGWVVRSPTP